MSSLWAVFLKMSRIARLRGGQAQGECRVEVGQNLLVGVGGSMVGLVHDKVGKGILPEVLQMERHTLDTAAHHMGIRLLDGFHVPSHGDLRPEIPEGVSSLVDQLLGVCQKERPPAAALGVHHGGDGLAGAGGVVEQRDGFVLVPHGLQGVQGFPLVLLQF